MRLLTFDPGETTGWCFLADGDIVGGSFPEWRDVHSLVVEHEPEMVVYESFHLRQNAAYRLIGSSFPTCQVIGVIKYVALEAGLPIDSQPPAMRTGIVLVRVPGFNEHARDALRHGIRYLSRQGQEAPYARFRRKRKR